MSGKNFSGANAVADGFNAMGIGDMAVISYNTAGQATGIDLFRTMTGAVSAVSGDTVTVVVGTTIPGWDGNAPTGFVANVVVPPMTGATVVTKDGRSASFTAVAVGDIITVTWKATATKVNPVAATLVAKNLSLEGSVTQKQVEGTTITFTIKKADNNEVTVTIGANPIVIKNGVTATVADILINDNVKCNAPAGGGTATYFEVMTP